MFSVDQAEMMLAQARMLCDAGSSLVQAETVTRNAMGLLAPKGRVRRGKRAQLLISESALLLGRIYRGLGKLEQASVWLTRAWKMYNDLPGASSDPHIQTRLSECSNHLTLIVIEDLRIAARAVRTPRQNWRDKRRCWTAFLDMSSTSTHLRRHRDGLITFAFKPPTKTLSRS